MCLHLRFLAGLSGLEYRAGKRKDQKRWLHALSTWRLFEAASFPSMCLYSSGMPLLDLPAAMPSTWAVHLHRLVSLVPLGNFSNTIPPASGKNPPEQDTLIHRHCCIADVGFPFWSQNSQIIGPILERRVYIAHYVEAMRRLSHLLDF